jgi:hypothetical protein
MTPQPPSSSDGSPLPPRHRPMLGDLAKDTTEIDLWAFEDDLEDIDSEAPPDAGRSQSTNIPAPRESTAAKKKAADRGAGQKTPEGGENRIRMNVNKPRLKGRSAEGISGQSKPESDFDDLEEWNDAPARPAADDLPLDDLAADDYPVEAVEPPKTVVAPVPEMPISKPPETPQDEPAASFDEFSPVVKADAKPISLRPHLGLSGFERIGLISLLVLLLGGSIWLLATTVFRLPKPAVRLQARDFPIQGEKFRVNSAECYWRKPITEGEHADVCRRGTLLLPVIEMASSDGSSTVRVFFKDDEGNTVGDPIIRKVGNGTVKIAGTAGIEDAGIFAAYRTGNNTRWTAVVFEIPSGDIAKGEGKKLFEMEIPAERR